MRRTLWALTISAALVSQVAGAQSIRTGKTATGIAYDVQGSGPVAVLISGSNLDRRMWAREAAWLAVGHTVVRYDLRAHGQSDGATTPFSNLGDLVSVLADLKIEHATLIGLSAGSTIALDAALAMPARVDRIVLAGPSISGFVPKERPPFVADLMAALKAADYTKAGEVLLATTVFAAPPESQPLVRRMVMENDRLWAVPAALMTAPQPAVNRLEAVRAPTLVLIGENDRLQAEQADLLATRIPGARLVRIPGGGHLLNLTSPQEFQSAVSAFLAERPR